MTYDQFKKTVQAKSISNKISVKNQEKYTKEVYKDSLNIINAPGFNINNLKSEIPVIEDNCIN